MTQAGKKRMGILARLPCLCCVVEGVSQPWPTEVHHIVDNGYRKHSGGDDSTLPLCAWHHRGLIPDGMTGGEASFTYGPSLATNKRAFVLQYGTERQLLERVNGLLGAV